MRTKVLVLFMALSLLLTVLSVHAMTYVYTYEEMLADVRVLAERAPGYVHTETLTETPDGREIPMLRLGDPQAGFRFLVQAGMHAREYINAKLVLKQAEELILAHENGTLGDDFCVYIIPMVNPDGIALSQQGPDAIRNPALRAALNEIAARENAGSLYWQRWKANAEGVDLNRNYDIHWDTYEGSPRPSSEMYKGSEPGCAKETRVLLRLIRDVRFDFVLSYHTSASEVFWDYGSDGAVREADEELARAVSVATGYPMVSTIASSQDSAGLSDWLVLTQGVPAVTIETCVGSSPVDEAEFPIILDENRTLLTQLIRYYTEGARIEPYRRDFEGYGTVVNCESFVTLRADASTSAKALAQVPLGAKVECHTGTGNFTYCRYMGSEGFILTRYLCMDGVVAGTVVNCNEYVTLRATPSTSANGLARVPLGASVMCHETSGEFTRCEYAGMDGYILTKYLAIGGKDGRK